MESYRLSIESYLTVDIVISQANSATAKVMLIFQRLIELSKKIDMKALEGNTKISEEFKVIVTF